MSFLGKIIKTGVVAGAAYAAAKIGQKYKEKDPTGTAENKADVLKEAANEFKQDRFMGLHGLPLLSLGYKIMPLAASEEIIKIGYANPLIAMSNIGILETDKLALEGHEPTDGFMSGAVKYKPYVLLSATSMRKELTLSMCVRGNDEDKRIVEHFFDLIEKSIDLLIAEE